MSNGNLTRETREKCEAGKGKRETQEARFMAAKEEDKEKSADRMDRTGKEGNDIDDMRLVSSRMSPIYGNVSKATPMNAFKIILHLT